jgi:hypothetical protein
VLASTNTADDDCAAPLQQLRPAVNPILAALRNGVAKPASKLSRALSSLKWRQSYLGQDTYVYPMEDGQRMLTFKQLEGGGELSGVGTGAVVWPAACVLSKYIERTYDRGSVNSAGSCCWDGMRDMRVCDIGSGTGIHLPNVCILRAHVS